jgi:hypothetical protein
LKLFSSCSLLSNSWMLLFGTTSVLLLAISIGLAVACAINRLRDFRLTASNARNRWRECSTPGDSDASIGLGEWSWRLLYGQLGLFAGGVVTASIFIALSFRQ